jgi:MFS family permease
MTTAQTAIAARDGTAAKREQKLPFIIAASSAGTLIEFYDFYLYGVLAGFFAAQFFPGDLRNGFLFSLGIFWTGFVVRPLGAIIFGYLGDLIGRKYTFMLSLGLMGLSTFLVGCLPTYASIGWLAPVLLVACRVVQALRSAASTAARRPMSPSTHQTDSAASTRAGSRPPPRWAS